MGGARSDYVMAKNNTLSHARVPVASARVYIHTSVFPLTRGRERERDRERAFQVCSSVSGKEPGSSWRGNFGTRETSRDEGPARERETVLSN